VRTANPKTLRADVKKLRGNERRLHNVLRLLFELLEEYSPPWYEKHHHDQAKVALKKPDVCYRSSLPVKDLLGTRVDAGGIHLMPKGKNVQMPGGKTARSDIRIVVMDHPTVEQKSAQRFMSRSKPSAPVGSFSPLLAPGAIHLPMQKCWTCSKNGMLKVVAPELCPYQKAPQSRPLIFIAVLVIVKTQDSAIRSGK